MPILIRFIVLGLIIYMIFRIIRPRSHSGKSSRKSRNRSGFKCEFCIHCGNVFDDGVNCLYRGKKTFKNAVHIQNCIDYERDS